MPTLTLTPDAPEASVLLNVTGLPTSAPITITRTDANGTASVRQREGQTPSGGVFILTDYEAAMVGGVTYTVFQSGALAATASTTLATAGAAPVLTNIQLPAVRAYPEWVTGYEASASSATVVHWPVDRGDPIVMVRPARTREGSLTVRASSYEAAHTLAAVMSPGRLLLLRQSDYAGLDMYFVCVDASVSPLELTGGVWAWGVVARYVEVRSPAVPLLGDAGWTFAELTAGYADFQSVRTSFASFADLLVGPS